jgi:hypothetical protein
MVFPPYHGEESVSTGNLNVYAGRGAAIGKVSLARQALVEDE